MSNKLTEWVKGPPDRCRGQVGVLSFLRDRDSLVVNLLAGFSVVVAILVRVVWANTPNDIPGFAHLGQLGSDVCVGYISAWIVYYLVSWRPRRQERNRALLQVANAATNVSRVGTDLLAEFRHVANDTSTGPITQESLASMVGKLDTNDLSGMVGTSSQPCPIIDMLMYHKMRVQDFVAVCMRLGLYLDSQLTTALVEISECALFKTVGALAATRAKAYVFNLAPDLYELFVICDELRDLLVDDYGVNGISIETGHVADGPQTWRAGEACPWHRPVPSDSASGR